MIRATTRIVLFPALYLLGVATADAAPVNFLIDSTQSLVTMSGSMVSGEIHDPQLTIGIKSQALGPYPSQNLSNSLQTRLNNEYGVANYFEGIAIQFLGSDILANNGGDYRPGATPGVSATSQAPANIGATAPIPSLGGIDFAIRGLVFDITSAVVPLSGPTGNWTFPVSGQVLKIEAGRLDYAGTGAIGGAIGTGTFDLAGLSGMNIASGSGQLLTGTPLGLEARIPISLRFQKTILGGDTPTATDDFFLDIYLTGMVVASVPEASSLTFLGLTGVVVGVIGYRRSRCSARLS
ncbi:MAG: hypothetical protein U1D30_23670 [Planctomycetota bacterium]